MSRCTPDAAHINAEPVEGGPGFEQIITPEALTFLCELHRRFNPERLRLLRMRIERQQAISSGNLPDFLSETRSIRQGEWRVKPAPADLRKRHVEITGPTDAKMVINALNCGADVFMADFEDANAPTWNNMVQGQCNLHRAVRRELTLETPQGKSYQLNDEVATLMVRPRGWHLEEQHVLIDDQPVSGSLFDFGLYLFHNAHELMERGSAGPYFYLPKLEGHLEARLWNEVFDFSEHRLGLAAGTIRATVLIETIVAAFEMDEILFELRSHILGLNAGRWDYIFSIIKKFKDHPWAALPDRSQVTMTVPFMRAYANLLVQTCHKRGAYAMGGMAAFIPSRRDANVNEIALMKVREDKAREAADGFDGTWVAHPDLVSVAKEIFEKELGERDNQLERAREDVRVAADDLLNFNVPAGRVTEQGLRSNIAVALQYIESWLRGQGAVAINNLMEDTATAEISRAQLWQWIHHRVSLDDGRIVTAELFRTLLREELQQIHQVGDSSDVSGFEQAAGILAQLATDDRFADFLTLATQEQLEQSGMVEAIPRT